MLMRMLGIDPKGFMDDSDVPDPDPAKIRAWLLGRLSKNVTHDVATSIMVYRKYCHACLKIMAQLIRQREITGVDPKRRSDGSN